MSIDTVNAQVMQAIQGSGGTAASSTAKKNTLNVDDFLKLFITQMTHQDPLSGSSDSSGADYMSQLAQITMMEQLSSINEGIVANQTYGMIGKYVYIGDGAGSDLIFGKVDGVVNEGGVNYLMVGGETYSLTDVYAAVDGGAVDPASNDEILKSADMIGRNIAAKIADEAGVESIVTGKVEKMHVKDGVVYLVVAGRDVPLSSIVEVAPDDSTQAIISEPPQETLTA